MACITERRRAGKPSAWQAVIRVTGHPPVVKTFDTADAAKKFAAFVEESLRRQNKAAAKALNKLRRAQPSHASFYELRLRDIIEDFAFGPRDAITGERLSTANEPQNKSPSAKGPRPKQRVRPRHLPQIGAHRDSVATVLANIGQIAVGEARKSWVIRYVEKMRQTKSIRDTPYSYVSIAKHIALMRAACLAAAAKADVEDPKLYFNLDCFPERWKSHRERRLEFGEHQKIMSTLNTDATTKGRFWRCFYRFTLETGARLQESVLAEWSEFGHPGAWVIPAAHTKKKRSRIVSLSPRARRILNILRAMSAKHSTLVFHEFGTVASVSKAWARQARRAGISDLHFHDLRHEAITRMVLHPAKLRLETIQQMVGHRSAEMTARYTHLRPHDFVGLFDAS